MRRRKLLAWAALAVLAVMLLDSLGELALWAQEGALEQAEQLEGQRQEVGGGSSQPGRRPYAVEEPTGGTSSRRWGNMNWFALYLVLAGPTTYFVFRGAAR